MALKASEGSDRVKEVGDMISTDEQNASQSGDLKGKLVHKPQPEYTAFMDRLKLIHAMLGGTYELRKLSTYSEENEYLPAEQEESEKSYNARRSFNENLK